MAWFRLIEGERRHDAVEELSRVCQEIVVDLHGVLACAVADADTGRVLAVASDSAMDREGLDLVCRSGAEMFLGRSIRQFARAWRGADSLDGGFVREVQVTTATTRQFIAAIPEGWNRLLVLVTDRSESIGIGWMAVHDGVNRLAGPADAPAPAPEPVFREPAPVVHEPAPVTHEPAPVVHEPAPVAHEPAPVTHEPAPVTHEPAPMAHEPAPMAHEPAPVAHEPAPVAYEPAPVAHEPAPVAHEPPPVVHEPAPVVHEPPAMTHEPASVVADSPDYVLDEPPVRPVRIDARSPVPVEPAPVQPAPTPVVADRDPPTDRPASRAFVRRTVGAGRMSFVSPAPEGDGQPSQHKEPTAEEPPPDEQVPAPAERRRDSFKRIIGQARQEEPRGPRGNMFSRR